jgi:drug/metabolite transporter (DMT)-like permease
VDALALALVVAAAFIHATWNLLSKRSGGGRLFIWSYSAVTAVLYLPLAVWLAARHAGSWHPLVPAAIVASGLLHLLYATCLQAGYRKADLSVVYPVARGTGPALSVLGAILLLGEPASAPTLGGTALIVSGVLVIGLAGARARARGPVWPGIRWGALTGLVIACYTVADGYTVRALALSPILLDYFGNLVRLASLTPLAVRRRAELAAEWRANRGTILAVGALVPVSYVLVLYAMTRAPVSVIAPARELSMMVGVLFGWWLLREPDVARRLAGSGLIAAGVVLLAL